MLIEVASIGIFQAGLLVLVAVGPIIGGALAGSLGWRSIFWFLAIYSGAFLLLLAVLLPETLRPIVGNGSRMPSSLIAKYPLLWFQRTTRVVWDTALSQELPAKKRIDLLGPFCILTSKQAAPIIVFLATYYAVWQMSITAMSTLFQKIIWSRRNSNWPHLHCKRSRFHDWDAYHRQNPQC